MVKRMSKKESGSRVSTQRLKKVFDQASYCIEDGALIRAIVNSWVEWAQMADHDPRLSINEDGWLQIEALIRHRQLL